MTLEVCYNRPSFFGGYELARDMTYSGTIDRLKKAFRALKKDREFTIHVDGKYSIFWNTATDYEAGIITLRIGTGNWLSYDEKKVSFENAKKELLKAYTE